MTTKSETESARKEVSKNYAYFKKMLPEWRDEHPSEFVLLHHQKLVDFFESEKDAIRTGVRDYGWGDFSIQAINETSIDLGFQTHVIF